MLPVDAMGRELEAAGRRSLKTWTAGSDFVVESPSSRWGRLGRRTLELPSNAGAATSPRHDRTASHCQFR